MGSRQVFLLSTCPCNCGSGLSRFIPTFGCVGTPYYSFSKDLSCDFGLQKCKMAVDAATNRYTKRSNNRKIILSAIGIYIW